MAWILAFRLNIYALALPNVKVAIKHQKMELVVKIPPFEFPWIVFNFFFFLSELYAIFVFYRSLLRFYSQNIIRRGGINASKDIDRTVCNKCVREKKRCDSIGSWSDFVAIYRITKAKTISINASSTHKLNLLFYKLLESFVHSRLSHSLVFFLSRDHHVIWIQLNTQ